MQVAVRLAAWVADSGAASVVLRPGFDADPKGFTLGTMDESFGDRVLVQWTEHGQLADALMAPCSRRGLSCRLEQVSKEAAIVMRRHLCCGCECLQGRLLRCSIERAYSVDSYNTDVVN